jgi:hypothetical protein
MRGEDHSRIAPRFKVGDTVCVKSKGRLPFDGLTGRIVEIRESRWAALDRYVIHIEGRPEREMLLESELTPV